MSGKSLVLSGSAVRRIAALVTFVTGAVVLFIYLRPTVASRHVDPSVFPVARGAERLVSYDDPPIDAKSRPQIYDRWLVLKAPPGLSEREFEAAEVERLRSAGWRLERAPSVRQIAAHSSAHGTDLAMTAGSNAALEFNANRFPMPAEVEIPVRHLAAERSPILVVELLPSS